MYREDAKRNTASHKKDLTDLQESMTSFIQKPSVLPDEFRRQNHAISLTVAEEHEKTRTTILAAMSKEDTRKVEHMMLNSLKFAQMQDRHEEILAAHVRTFKWVFDETAVNAPWDNLANWLREGHGTYWVSGKAGSGKSTLMRNIVDHTSTQSLLKKWSGDAELDLAAFFFWDS